LCAHCGESLVGRGQIVYTFGDLPGKPAVGWHIDGIVSARACFKYEKSMFARPLDEQRTAWKAGQPVIIDELAKIEARGPGRVVRTSAKCQVPSASPRVAP